MSSHKFIRNTGILNTDKNRFYFNILIPEKENGCMIWKGTVKKNGYGQFEFLNKKWIHAHRFSYEFYNEKIPNDLCVLHKCDNRKCINPNHLFLGSKKENTKDMFSKNRYGYPSAKGEKNNKAKLKEQDVINIRKKYKEGMNCSQIAKIYNMSISTINRIVLNKYWKHLTAKIKGE